MHMIVVKFEIKNPQEITNSVKFGIFLYKATARKFIDMYITGFLSYLFSIDFHI